MVPAQSNDGDEQVNVFLPFLKSQSSRLYPTIFAYCNTLYDQDYEYDSGMHMDGMRLGILPV